MKRTLTVITPCFNEEENVTACYQRLRDVMLTRLTHLEYEHIFADNASSDKTLQVLRSLAKNDKRVKVIANSRNVGPFRNMWNALKSSSGDAVVPMLPADLQDPPEIIPNLVDRWESGDLVVYGIRSVREENYVMRFFRKAYYTIIKRFASFYTPMNAGEFLLADKRVIESILSIDDTYPYIRGLIAQTGVRSSSVEYTWSRRGKGKSKNKPLDLIDQAINGFVSTSRLPARLSLLAGFVLSLLGILAAALFLSLFLLDRQGFELGIPTLIVGLFLFSGLQLFFLGVIGEYVLSIHGQVRRPPPMYELERINF